MTIPNTIEGLINTSSKYKLSSLEISILIQEYCKQKWLIFSEGNNSITILRRGVEPHADGYNYIEKAELVYDFKTRTYQMGFNQILNLN